MMLTELTSVPESALPLAELRDHIRLGSGFADDALQDGLLMAYLRSALAAIENRTGKVLLERTFEWVLFEWRSPTKQPLPLAPVQDVPQIGFEDPDGSVAYTSEGWILKQDSQRPFLVPTGACLPAIPTDYALKIQMLAGFGASWSDVPGDLQQAVLMLAAYFYENRQESDAPSGGMPFGVRSLIEPYRTVRVFMGNS